MKKVLHIITGLDDGGAEGVLFRLCSYDKSAQHFVISLTDDGKYGNLLQELNVKVVALNMPKGRVTFKGIFNLFKTVRFIKPDIVQTWMYHSDLLGGFVSYFLGIKNIFWNVRNSSLVPGQSKKSTIFVAKLCALTSGFLPKKIICCSNESIAIHEKIGYKKELFKYVPNGYDLSKFHVSSDKRKLFREKYCLSETDIVLGMVGRYDPQKDHSNLISSISLFKKDISNFKFFLVGKGLDRYNSTLNKQIESLGLTKNIYLIGQQSDICSVMNGLDIHVLSSQYGEAFPNVLAEAMACGTPCISTDIGDSREIVNNLGWIVPPRDPNVLASAIKSSVGEATEDTLSWDKRRISCREYVVKNYSIDEMIKNYHSVWFSS